MIPAYSPHENFTAASVYNFELIVSLAKTRVLPVGGTICHVTPTRWYSFKRVDEDTFLLKSGTHDHHFYGYEINEIWLDESVDTIGWPQ